MQCGTSTLVRCALWAVGSAIIRCWLSFINEELNGLGWNPDKNKEVTWSSLPSPIPRLAVARHGSSLHAAHAHIGNVLPTERLAIFN
ncbi:hypothetical protein V8C86DRAFT_2622626 [Haematococcus lacustris]